jgi:hypothetical protein
MTHILTANSLPINDVTYFDIQYHGDSWFVVYPNINNMQKQIAIKAYDAAKSVLGEK